MIRPQAGHPPSGATPEPVRPWWSGTDATTADVDRLWQAFLRCFDIEHTFRPFKQTPGRTCPKIRTPEAADRWTWLIVVAFTQLRLARPPAPASGGRGKSRPRPAGSPLPTSVAAFCAAAAMLSPAIRLRPTASAEADKKTYASSATRR